MLLLAKRWFLSFGLVFFSAILPCRAGQFWGGELSYRLLNQSGSSYTYEITFVIFRDCRSDAELDDPVIRILNTTDITTNSHLLTYREEILDSRTIEPMSYSSKDYCVINDPQYCADKITFRRQLTLPASPEGYTLFYSGCCRNGISNLRSESWNGGIEMIYGVPEGGQSLTFFCKIPSHSNTGINSSPQSLTDSIIYACASRPLQYRFRYADADNDSLSYRFGLSMGKTGAATTTFIPLSYQTGFSVNQPVTGNPVIAVDPVTGIFTGTPSFPGLYVLVLLVDEYRNGRLINTHRKDFQLNVFDCELKKQEDIINCADSVAVFAHLNNQHNIYKWDFGVPGITSDTSAEHLPVYHYPADGIFTVKMKVTNPAGYCTDSAFSTVKLYPGIRADFSWSSLLCSEQPFTLTDRSDPGGGAIISRIWRSINPRRVIGTSPLVQHKQTVTGSQPYPLSVELVIKTDLGCRDSVLKVVEIHPAVKVDAGPDRILALDQTYSMPVISSGATSFSWQPASGLNNPFTEKPVVSSRNQTITYIVRASNNGNCTAADTVTLRYMKGPELYVPTAFTPDQNGLNDRLRFFPVSMDVISFSVFDRWGNRVFETTDPSTGWDGRYRNLPATAGVYIWVATLRDMNGQTIQKKGSITLIR